jgi:transposase
MPVGKECPMCGESMRLKEGEVVVRVPGNPNATTRKTREWLCPECDYFEEADAFEEPDAAGT